MARVDKVVTSGRTYSVVLLTLTIAVATVTAAEVSRLLLLSQARTTLSHWIVCDFLIEDFEDWWYRQKTSGSKVTDQFVLSADLHGGRERYYSNFGSAVVVGQGSSWFIAVRQPARSAGTAGLPNIPDVRAYIPDLLPWIDEVHLPELAPKILEPLSTEEAAIEEAKLGLDSEYKRTHPQAVARLPAILKEDWSADRRWLTLGSEKEKGALQLREIARAARVSTAQDSTPPAIYRDTERTLTTSTVKVPLIDAEMPTQSALWVLAVLVFLTGIVLQATLERLESENLQEREELWLLIDAKPGVSRVLAMIWLSITLASPVLIPIIVLVVILLRATASGGSIVGAFAGASPLVLLALVSSWSSRKTYRMLKKANHKPEATVSVPALANPDGLQGANEVSDTVITDDAAVVPLLETAPAPTDPAPPR